MPTIRDHFSDQASNYAQYRPTYPPELFTFLAKKSNDRHLVWDCATGNGQAAVGLAKKFKKVWATDASQRQLEQAIPMPNIFYRQETAYESSLKDHSVDLVTVAQAVHWFDLNDFYKEAKRVMKPKAGIAIWTYNRFYFENQNLNKILDYFYRNLVADYWQFDRKLIETGYRTLPFPFSEITTPKLTITHHWNLEQVIRYLYTWSSVRNFQQKTGEDPIQRISDRLIAYWGEQKETRAAYWDLFLRVGYKI